jgi:hypothetical protein
MALNLLKMSFVSFTEPLHIIRAIVKRHKSEMPGGE